jgi:thiamine transport system substrate-binding protein
MANGTKLTSGWTDAYEVDFTAGGGGGSRPIVLSYNSSPPFTIPEGGSRPTTSALLDTCFRQVEYAGVLAGAENREGAEAFIDFLVGREFQESLPDNMFVFPVNQDAELPELWARWAKPAPEPIEVDAATIAANRDDWLTAWGELTTR